ncbi:MAG: hypothetical protein HRT77_11805 [Halioglobus sp.]|nr:hypothetical protein [Halioglobus sp.]
MCHEIEDPAFDATAVATKPRVQVRPIHRPPRQQPNQVPDCHWRVKLNPDVDPARERDITTIMAQRRLARIDIPRKQSSEPGGWDYYDGPLVEQLHLEAFYQSALAVICKELAVQVQKVPSSIARS